MLQIVLTLVLLSVIAWFRRRPVFESTVLSVLLSPVVVFGFGLAGIAPAQGACIAALGLSLLLSLAILPITDERKSTSAAITLIVSFFTFYCLSLLWPDFIAIGERLRDYSMLSSIIKSPIDPKEPWMSGAILNYYVYWYRVGHFFSTLLNLPVWETYHALSAFALALYLSACLQLFYRYLRLPLVASLGCAVLVALGSNAQGVWNFLNRDQNWWGPSRVVTGAINEFPAWSFLLGDIHPHYLNLGLVPFGICLVHILWDAWPSRIARFLVAAFIAIIAPLWVFSANAWEVPVLLLLIGVSAAAGILSWFYETRGKVEKSADSIPRQEITSRAAILITFLLFVLGILLLSSFKNLTPPTDPWSLTATRTPLSEMMLHWGIPLVLAAACLAALNSSAAGYIATSAALILTALFETAWPFLLALLLLTAWRLFRRTKEHKYVLTEILGIAGLLAVLFPEIAFKNDPYGSEIDRMNTIFKFYSASWFLLHCFAFSLAFETWQKIKAFIAIPLRAVVTPAVLVLLLGFFFQTIALRESKAPLVIRPRAQGLNVLEQNHPGAGKAIQVLERARDGVVLEAQGNPYSYTSHVSTLSSKPAFLGWSNHVGLLLKNYDEIKRRESLADEIYRSKDCGFIAEKMREEGIKYLVVGPLEQERYGGDLPETNCLSVLVESGSYKIFSVS